MSLYTPQVWTDDATLVDSAHLTHIEDGIEALDNAVQTKEDKASKAVANGYASLDATGKVPAAQLPPTGAVGPAGGVLGGTYPNPTFAQDMATQTELDAAVATSNTNLANKLDKNSVVPAFSPLLTSKLNAGDADPFLRIDGNGKIQWGQVLAGTYDTDLYRVSAGFLGTDSGFTNGRVTLTNPGDPGIGLTVGSAGAGQVGLGFLGPGNGLSVGNDTYLYRKAAGVFRTDGTLDANALTINGVPVGTGGASGPAGGDLTGNYPNPTVLKSAGDFAASGKLRVSASADLSDTTGAMTFGLSSDTNLYRAGGGILKTDGAFYARSDIYARLGTTYQIGLTTVSGTYGGIVWNNDTNLYRPAAGRLKTDGRFDVGGKAYVQDHLVTYGYLYVQPGTIFFGADDTGATPDTNLYRSAAKRLQTDGSMWFAPTNATDLALIASTYSDSIQRFQVRADGRIDWGPGGSTAVDTNLYRLGAGLLKTDGLFLAAGSVQARHGGANRVIVGEAPVNTAAAGITFGDDTTLYRVAANVLQTSGRLIVGSDVGGLALQIEAAPTVSYPLYYRIAGEANPRFRFNQNALMEWGPGGATAPDTTLYRAAAANLKTDGTFSAGITRAQQYGIFNDNGSAPVLGVGYNFNTGQFCGIGFTYDTLLYRASAGVLKTDGDFRAVGQINARDGGAGQVRIGSNTGGAYIDFGPASDTNLYRSAANMLSTDGHLRIAGQFVLDMSNGGNKLYFGSALDTNLYRVGAGQLKTDGLLSVGGILNVLTPGGSGTFTSLGLNPNGVGARTVEAGPADSAGAGYRTLRIAN